MGELTNLAPSVEMATDAPFNPTLSAWAALSREVRQSVYKIYGNKDAAAATAAVNRARQMNAVRYGDMPLGGGVGRG